MSAEHAVPGLVPYAEAVAAVAARDENVEGVPVFLALEGAGADVSDAEDTRLGRLALAYLDAQLGDREQATLDDVATVMKVLGAHHFDEPDVPR